MKKTKGGDKNAQGKSSGSRREDTGRTRRMRF